MSSKVQQSVCSDCVTYAKSKIKFNTLNTFNNVVQKYVEGCIFGKWVNIKGFQDKKKAVALMSLLEH